MNKSLTAEALPFGATGGAMTVYEKTSCRVHGEQQRTYVCQHIYAGLVARERVGFFAQ
jgi:hydroxylamine reductase (hybrid-cluster protein)